VKATLDGETVETDATSRTASKADVTALALESTLTAMKGAGWTTETLKAIKDAVDAITPGDDAATIVTALLAKTGVTAVGTATVSEILAAVYAAARGKFVKNEDGSISIYDDDDTAVLFTLTPALTGRTTA